MAFIRITKSARALVSHAVTAAPYVHIEDAIMDGIDMVEAPYIEGDVEALEAWLQDGPDVVPARFEEQFRFDGSRLLDPEFDEFALH